MSDQRPTGPAEWISPPGETISDLLEEKGWTQAELGMRLGYTSKHVSLLINGKASITEDTALRLERVLGGDMGFWLSREAQFRENLARAGEAQNLEKDEGWLKELPLNDMFRFGWIKRESSRGQQVAECLRYFGVASVETWRASYADPTALGVAYRASDKFSKISGHIATWLRQGEIVASTIPCKTYSAPGFKALLQDLRSLTLQEDPEEFVPCLVQKCAEVGVAVAFVPAPKGCPVSGVTRWLSPDKALLMLSLRYKTNDSLWFTFFHEAGHIILHSKKLMFLELAKDGMSSTEEREADAFAQDTLIPPGSFSELLGVAQVESEINRFAKKIGIAPGIVVGRLQKEKLLPWSRMRHLKVSYVWNHDE